MESQDQADPLALDGARVERPVDAAREPVDFAEAFLATAFFAAVFFAADFCWPLPDADDFFAKALPFPARRILPDRTPITRGRLAASDDALVSLRGNRGA